MHRFSFGMALVTSASVLALFQSPASAQVTGQASVPEGQESSRLDEIIVTAQRRSENVQDVPAAIAAFSEEQLTRAGVSSTRDLQIVTPSLSFVQASFAPQPTIRGIGTRNVNPGDEQVVPIYLDGVYQPFIVGGIFELSNVDRIEVLKGPQGTLLGRNATGGAINILTNRPTVEPEATFSVGFGSLNERSASGYVSAGTGPVAVSLTAQYIEDDGYVHEQIRDREIAALKSVFLRGQLFWQIGENTELTLAGSLSDRDDTTSLAVYPFGGNTSSLQGNPGLVITTADRQSRLNILPSLTVGQEAISATLVHHFGTFDLTSVSGYSENTLVYNADVDATSLPTTDQRVSQFENGFSQDLYLSSTTDGPFSWVAGLFYFDDVAGFDPRLSGVTITNVEATTQAWAAYAQGSYELTDALSITAGGRFSHDEKCASANNGIGTRSMPETCAEWESFDPSVTLDYELFDATKIYARYATAYKSGVFNAAAYSPIPVEPEEVTTYEIGLKSDPLPWLRTNIAIFTTDYQNIQVNTRDPVTTAVVLQNAAAATLTGIEADVYLSPIDGLNLRASISSIDAKYDSFPAAQIFVPRAGGGNTTAFIDASGFRLVRTPDLTASISGDYTVTAFDGDLTFSANAYYQGGFNWSLDGRLQQPSYTTINGQIAWRDPSGRYELALWGRNLSDVEVPLSLITSTINDQASYNRPRTFGVKLTGRF